MADSALDTLRHLDFYSADAIESIARERLRQIVDERWTPTHDDEHGKGEMAAAASCYLANACLAAAGEMTYDHPPAAWPWDLEWWKPKTPRADLIRAAALTVAEMARRARTSGAASLQKEDRE